jgi:hypothetical protein
LQHEGGGTAKVRGWVEELVKRQGGELRTQPYLCVRRGPYVVAAVLDETVSNDPVLTLKGTFVDLFEPALPLVTSRTLHRDERALLYDIHWAVRKGIQAKVLAAGARVRNERVDGGALAFTMRGPAGSTANARVFLPGPPRRVTTDPALDVRTQWDAPSSTLWLAMPNVAADVSVRMEW